MTIQMLIEELHLSSIKWLQRDHESEPVYSHRRLTENTECEPSILYVCMFSELPALSDESHLSFLCVADSEAAFNEDASFPGRNNIILAPVGQSLDALDRALCRAFHEETKYTDYCTQIITAVNSGCDLKQLVNLVFRLTGNPAFVSNTEFCLTAMSDYSTPERPDFDDQKDAGHLMEKNISNLKHDKVIETIQRTGKPYLSRLVNEPDWLHDIVYLHGIEFGEVAFMELDHSFTSQDFRLIRFFSMVAASIMEQGYVAQQNRGYLYSTLLSDLLHSEHLDKSLIEFRMDQLHWSITDDLFLMVVYDNNASAFKRRSQFICEHIQGSFNNCKWTIYDGKLYFLIAQPDSSLDAFRENEALLSYLKKNHLTATVSNCYHDVLFTKNAAEQCGRAGTLGKRHDQNRSLYCFSDYYMDYIAASLSSRRNPLEYCDPEVLRIAEYDLQNATEYLKTLKAYLRHTTVPKDVADELHIHKNTLSYRLNKIKELFHIDLQNGDVCFQVRLTIALLEYGNLLEDPARSK